MMKFLRTKWMALAAMVLLTGCAGTPVHEPQPKIARLTPEELDRLMPKQVPNLSLDAIVQLSQSGENPDAIISRIGETRSEYVLTPQQIIELNRKGVDMKVLDYMFNAQQQALRDSIADEFNQRELKNTQEIEALRRELMNERFDCDPFWAYPYGYPYWRHW